MRLSTRQPPTPVSGSAFADFRIRAEVIKVAVRCDLPDSLYHRDVEELPAEHGVHIHHVTAYRWVQRFAPLLAVVSVVGGAASIEEFTEVRGTA